MVVVWLTVDSALPVPVPVPVVVVVVPGVVWCLVEESKSHVAQLGARGNTIISNPV